MRNRQVSLTRTLLYLGALLLLAGAPLWHFALTARERSAPTAQGKPVEPGSFHRAASSPTATAGDAAGCDHACRFWGMIGVPANSAEVIDQLVAGTHSLESLAASNPDGWGVAYRSPLLAAAGLARPVVLRGGPQANHPHDDRFAAAVSEFLALEAPQALAHIRNATTGHTGAPDPHPFVRDDFLFMHNGTVLSGELLELLTVDDPDYLSTHPTDFTDPYVDSELYALLVEKLRSAGVVVRDGRRSFATVDAIAEAALRIHLAQGVATAANCLAAVPDTLFAVRFDENGADRYRVRYKKIPGAWVVASEPVGSDTTGWLSLPPMSMAAFTATEAPVIRSVYPPPGPYLTLAAQAIADTLGGNADGGLDAGEIIHLRAELTNVGADSAFAVVARLRSTSPHLTLKDSLAAFGDFASQETKPGLEDDHFVFQVSGACPDQEQLDFQLFLTEQSGDDWTAHFDYAVDAPVITLALVAIDDSTGGDGDGVLEPGEEGLLTALIANGGHTAATNLAGTLTSGSDSLIVTQAVAFADTLAPDSDALLTPPFEVRVDPGAPSPAIVHCTLTLEGDWHLDLALPISVPLGGFRDAMEAGPGAWTHTVVTPGFADEWHLSAERNHTPGGAWSWKFGGPGAEAYADSADGALTTPPIEILEQTQLVFWHHMTAEALLTGQGDAYDGGLVELSLDGGPWQQITPVGGYPYTIRPSLHPGPFPEGTPVYSGSQPWAAAEFMIIGPAGEARFRFRFGSNGTTGYEGWYIDDVEVFSWSPGSAAMPDPPPVRLRLGANHPNPFSPETEIDFALPRAQPVRLRILDAQGRVVRTLLDRELPAGAHRIRWDGRDGAGRAVASGVYFYRLQDGAATRTRKMTLVR